MITARRINYLSYFEKSLPSKCTSRFLSSSQYSTLRRSTWFLLRRRILNVVLETRPGQTITLEREKLNSQSSNQFSQSLTCHSSPFERFYRLDRPRLQFAQVVQDSKFAPFNQFLDYERVRLLQETHLSTHRFISHSEYIRAISLSTQVGNAC